MGMKEAVMSQRLKIVMPTKTRWIV